MSLVCHFTCFTICEQVSAKSSSSRSDKNNPPPIWWILCPFSQHSTPPPARPWSVSPKNQMHLNCRREDEVLLKLLQTAAQLPSGVFARREFTLPAGAPSHTVPFLLLGKQLGLQDFHAMFLCFSSEEFPSCRIFAFFRD